ncbi:MAG: HAD family hydrolase [Nitrospiraceae bacterium]|nr:HAD family hydrolase [Nitrospiraceae bacterium]
MKRQAVFFDLYGTLIDIFTDEQDPWVYSALSQYLGYHLVRISPEELKKTYFEEIRLSLNLSNEPHSEVDIYKIFYEIMRRYGQDRPAKSAVIAVSMLYRSLTRRRFGLFSNVSNAVSAIARLYKIAIISDAQWVFTEPEMEMLGLTRFFRTALLSSRFGYKKPDTRLFHTAMSRLWVKPEDSVYIGDNPEKDLVGAKKAGMKFIMFRGGGGPFDFKPDARFSDYSELEGVVKKVLPPD